MFGDLSKRMNANIRDYCAALSIMTPNSPFQVTIPAAAQLLHYSAPELQLSLIMQMMRSAKILAKLSTHEFSQNSCFMAFQIPRKSFLHDENIEFVHLFEISKSEYSTDNHIEIRVKWISTPFLRSEKLEPRTPPPTKSGQIIPTTWDFQIHLEELLSQLFASFVNFYCNFRFLDE